MTTGTLNVARLVRVFGQFGNENEHILSMAARMATDMLAAADAT